MAPDGVAWLAARVAPPEAEVRTDVEHDGLAIREADAAVEPLFIEVAGVLAEHPSLAASVAEAVGVIHLLQTSPAYDLSHSEPRWANRIFVSIPERIDRIGALRLAESVVHEAMHLQLTKLEATTPLVRDAASTLHSPWRMARRPAGGVLHGLYVFVSLRAFFEAHVEALGSAGRRHLAQRKAEIDAELLEVDFAALAANLTPAGQVFLAKLRHLGAESERLGG